VWGIQKQGTSGRRAAPGRRFFEARAESPIVLENGYEWGVVRAVSDHPTLVSEDGMHSIELVSRLIASRIDQDGNAASSLAMLLEPETA